MSTPSSDPNASLSVRLARQIDERCDQFEEQWKQGATPRIEDFLADVSESTRPRLLEELLLLDVHFRARGGDLPQTEDYLSRFPELTDEKLKSIIRRGAGSPQRGSTPGDQSTVAHQSGDSARVAGPRLRYFGDYELLEQIARGGMGVVYKARQISLNRLVAVKMILSGQFASDAQVKRFYSEAESAAQLDHPCIVSVYEVGEHEGDHFFSMALVEGASLAAQLAAGPMEPRRAAEVVSQVARAIEYAHGKGVIHRDLKPSNILIDADGRPRVTDFGLAKRVSDADGLTMSGDVLGTPSYMPPEQAAGKIDAVGPASDVYALGAVLYALLAGRPPFQAASSVDTLRQVVDQEPVRLRQLNAAIPRDLETIAQKCLEKSVAKRYSTAEALAHDLDNYLAGRPIQARPTSRIERAWRLCRRNPVVASLSAAVVTALIAGTAVSSYFAISENRRAISENNSKLVAVKAMKQSDADRATAQTAELAERAAKLSEIAAKNLEIAQRKEAERQTRLANAQRLATQAREALGQYPQRSLLLAIEAVDATRASGEPVAAMAERVLRDGLASTGGIAIDIRPARIQSLAIGPGGRWLAAVDLQGTACLYDVSNVQEGIKPRILTGKDMTVVSISHDGRWLAAGGKKSLLVWDLSQVNLVKPHLTSTAHKKTINSLAFSPDARWLATGSDDKTVRLWDLSADDTSSQSRSLPAHPEPVVFVAFSPNGRWLVTVDSGSKGGAQAWDLAGETPVARQMESRFRQLKMAAFSWDSRWLAAAGHDKTLLWDLNDDSTKIVPLEHKSYDHRVLFSPDNRWLATGGYNASLCDLTAENPFARPQMLSAPGTPWAFTKDSHTLVTDAGILERGLRIWNVLDDGANQIPKILRGHDREIVAAQLCEARDVLFTGGADGSLRAWKLRDAAPRGDPIVLAQYISGHRSFAVMSPNGRWVATTPNSPFVETTIWDLESENPNVPALAARRLEPVETLSIRLDYPKSQLRTLTFTRDSKRLITGDCDHNVRIWDLKPAAGGPPRTLGDNRGEAAPPVDGIQYVASPRATLAKVLRGHARGVRCVAVSPDGHWLASGSGDKTIRLWDLTADDPEVNARSLKGHTGVIESLEFSPDSRWLASSGGSINLAAPIQNLDDTVRLWDITTTDPASCGLVLPGHTGGGTATFSPDSRWLFTGCVSPTDSQARLWDLMAKEVVANPRILLPAGATQSAAMDASFSRDGRWLATVGRASGTDLYDLNASQPGENGRRLTEIMHSGRVAMTHDCRYLVTTSGTGVFMWDLTSADPALEPLQLAGPRFPVDGVIGSEDGRWLMATSTQSDCQTYLWRLKIEELLALAQRAAARQLNANELRTFRVSSRSYPLQITELKASGEAFQPGDNIKFTYKVTNTSDKPVVLPSLPGNAPGASRHSAGLRQHQIEYLDRDGVIPSRRNTSIARTGVRPRYGVGGYTIDFAQNSIAAGESIEFEHLHDTTGYLPGQYSLHVEYKEPNERVLKQTASTQFSLTLPAGSPGPPATIAAAKPSLPEKSPPETKTPSPNLSASWAAVEKVRDEQIKRFRENPDNTNNAQALAASQHYLGGVYRQNGKHAESATAYEEARAIRAKLVEDEPSSLEYRSSLGATLNNFAMTHAATGRHEEALGLYRQAIEHQRMAFDKKPDTIQYRRFLSNHYAGMARALRNLSRPAEAAVTTLERKKLWPGDAVELYKAATEFAQCVPPASKELEQLTPEEQTERQKHIDLAVATLAEAIAAGFKNFEQMKGDPNLESLREDSGYKKLLK